MNHKITERQGRGFGQEIFSPTGAPGFSNQTIAEQVGLGDEGEIRAFKTMFDWQYGEGQGTAISSHGIRESVHCNKIAEIMIRQYH